MWVGYGYVIHHKIQRNEFHLLTKLHLKFIYIYFKRNIAPIYLSQMNEVEFNKEILLEQS